MITSSQRGSRVIYVAGSAREFPTEVQEWLARPENRAAALPSVYDALAELTRRPRPVAVLVSIEAVDWEEMEFFDLAARLSRDTSIYVAGHDHHRAKLDAALQHGARRFNAADLAHDLARPAPNLGRTTARDLLAGTLRSFPQAAGRNLHVTLVPTESAPAEPPDPVTVQPTPAVEDDSPQQPPVRLATPIDIDDDSLKPPEEPNRAIPFPWAPAPNRPKRTPPSAQASTEPPPGPRTPPGETPQPPEPPGRPTAPELTPEELAALMGRPANPPPPAKEQAS